MDSSLGHLQLAIELIAMIFREVDDLYDAIMLGLTHDALMVIGWEHIGALLVQDFAPWAGDRIIIAGSWGLDVPEGVISEEEKKKWVRRHLEKEGRELATLRLYEIFDGPFDVTRKNLHQLMKLTREESCLVQRIIQKGDKYQSEKGWVLMNQTKKEYVTSTAASRILPSMGNPNHEHCFGQLILFRICWSSHCEAAMRVSGGLNRGVWAGDRFMIVTVDVFEAMPSTKAWKDVSVEAAEWLKEILVSMNARY